MPNGADGIQNPVNLYDLSGCRLQIGRVRIA
jgi:hypothetical protein